MVQHNLNAVRAAAVGCGVTLLLIAITVFMLPTEELIDYLTLAGRLVGGGTTLGILMLATLPPLTGAIFYFIWKWALK
ncbi:hypothetical protein ACWIT3_01855 [Pasteurella sp. P03HT]